MYKLKQLINCLNYVVIVTIITCYATLAKSNNILMIKALIAENRQYFNVRV